ncbi:MAG: hypothetical protein V1904_10635 [Bacteroidota bacterium]
MKNIILLAVGVILIATGIICYFAIETATVQINGNLMHDAASKNLARYIFGGGVGGLGAIFTLGGLIGMARRKQQAKRNQYILQNGVDAVGTVTFADKNYYLTVNNRPIYSILEYTYQDKAGNQHTRRINNFNSEIMIRMQIQVGAKIAIKYSAQNPGESVIPVG